MSFQLKMEWKGLRQFQSVLSRAPRELRKRLHNKMDEGVEAILFYAKHFAPVRTGALRDSGQYRSIGFLTWIIEFLVGYAGFVEFGTSRMRAQPYLRPAVHLVSPQIQRQTAQDIYGYLAKEMRKVR